MNSAIGVGVLALGVVTMGCSAPLGEGDASPASSEPSASESETSLGQTQQALNTQAIPFTKAFGEGKLSPMPTTRTENSGSFLGWRGTVEQLPFGGSIRMSAFETDCKGSCSKSGKVHFQWGTFVSPTHGNFKFTSVAPLRVRGRTYVEGRGNFLTDYDASVKVHLGVTLQVCDPGSPCVTIRKDYFIEDDMTKSEKRNKSFSKDVYLSDLPSVGRFAGTYFTLEAVLTTSAWSSSDGEASVGVTELGFATTQPADAIVNVQW
jgi:hypothetical protein